jgi:hypothetical protein
MAILRHPRGWGTGGRKHSLFRRVGWQGRGTDPELPQSYCEDEIFDRPGLPFSHGRYIRGVAGWHSHYAEMRFTREFMKQSVLQVTEFPRIHFTWSSGTLSYQEMSADTV